MLTFLHFYHPQITFAEERLMVHIEIAHIFPVSVSDAFA
jgi:hypothetical protein